MSPTIGLDIGGTTISGALVDSTGAFSLASLGHNAGVIGAAALAERLASWASPTS